MKRILGLTLAVTASLVLATTASAEPLRIRGTIVATSSNRITVHTANGDVTASLNAKTGFVSVGPPTSIASAPAAIWAWQARLTATSGSHSRSSSSRLR
jgi:hypothetical protein